MTDQDLRTLNRHRQDGPIALQRSVRARRNAGQRSSVLECLKLHTIPHGFHCAYFYEDCPDPKRCPKQCLHCHGTGYRSLEDAVELAAYVGSPEARRSLGRDTLLKGGRVWTWDDVDNPHSIGLQGWLNLLATYGSAVMIRAAIAVGRACWDRHGDDTLADLDGESEAYRIRKAVEAAEAWLACPCAACAVKVAERFGALPPRPGPRDWCLSSACLVEGYAPSLLTQGKIQAAKRLLPEEQIRAAILGALVPWCVS